MEQDRALGSLVRRFAPFLRPACLALGLALAAVTAAAQVSTFDLSGVIKDEQGGVLPGVTVTMRNEATGFTRTVVSDGGGRYYFANLPPQGTWELSADLTGFSALKQPKLEFYADSKPVINLTMKVAALQETVTVSQEAPLIDTGQAALGLTINKDLINDLPLNGRDYLDLALLGSGVSDVGVDNVAGSKSQTINGAYSRYTSYSMDGFSNTRDQHGVAKANVPMDAMSEFRVQTNQFSAEYGETVGGIVTVITKSGTNKLTGSASLFVRPGSWDSPDPLSGAKAPFSRQDYAGAIGGPIVLDRTHYFVSADGRNQDTKGVVTAGIAGGQFKGTFPLYDHRGRVLAKVDHSFDANNSFTATLLVSRDTSTAGVGGLNVADNLSTSIDNNTDVNATYTRLFSNSRLNEFRIGVANEAVQTSTDKPQFTPTGVALQYQGQGNLGSTNRLQTSPDKSFQLGDTFTWHITAHTLKIGANTRSATPGGVLLTNIDGAYIFGPGAAYPYDPNNKASFPIQFQQGFFGNGTTEVSLKKWHYAAFVQDDWKVRDYLTLNLGLRYQVETVMSDHNNLRPRFGFAWDVTHDSRTVLRGGAGIFTGTVFSTVNAFEHFNGPDGFINVTIVPGDPNFPQFPGTLPGPQLPAGVTPPPGNDYLDVPTYAPDVRKSPESDNFTIGLDRQLTNTMTVALDFTYNRGVNLLVPSDVNAPAFFDYSTGLTRSPQAADATRPFGPAGRPIRPGELSFLPNGYPLSNYRQLYMIESTGESRYKAVGITVNKRFSNNFSFQGQYTWSRTTNNGDGFRPANLPNNPKDRNAEWGRSQTDVPHAFSVNGVYRLPYDFQVSGIVRAHSGQPINPVVGTDLNGDRNLLERPFANGVILARNSFSAPAFFEADLGFGKAIVLNGKRIEGRIEAFNITNHLNPASLNSVYGPNANAPLPTFLQINSSNPGRQYQLSVLFRF
ncbi:MAG TPA: carboxypeptidase regulatory-like domain-containing protein [Vicinamibacterales bacterium]|jgi:hypothetical protein|nr:carboxypeptidase regulatory-like domain-containing protein [Vicinamibacterales bacterium]